MAYTTTNFLTKKALKEALKAGRTVTCFQPNDMGFGPDLSTHTGTISIEGPHYRAHTWYARAELKNGKVVKVT